jgi:drug/metabolite transporter (DMT)-like permease
VAGLGLLIPDWHFGSRLNVALGFGVTSGLTFAVLTLVNRELTKALRPLLIPAVQTGVAGVLLLPLAAPGLAAAPRQDWLWLLLLGVACTALAHACFTASLARLEASVVGVIAALEPVYGMVLAWLLLGERPSLRLVGGGILIIGGACLAGRESHHEPIQTPVVTET